MLIILSGLLPCCLFQLNSSLLNPSPFQVFVQVHGSPSTDPASQNARPLGHYLCLLTAFSWPPPFLSLPTQTLSLLSTYSQSQLYWLQVSVGSDFTLQQPTASPDATPHGLQTIWLSPTHAASLALPPTNLPHPQAGFFSHPASAAPLNCPIITTKTGSFFRHLLEYISQHTHYLLLWITLHSNPCDPIDKYMFTYCTRRSPPGRQALLCPSQDLST